MTALAVCSARAMTVSPFRDLAPCKNQPAPILNSSHSALKAHSTPPSRYKKLANYPTMR